MWEIGERETKVYGRGKFDAQGSMRKSEEQISDKAGDKLSLNIHHGTQAWHYYCNKSIRIDKRPSQGISRKGDCTWYSKCLSTGFGISNTRAITGDVTFRSAGVTSLLLRIRALATDMALKSY